MIVIYDMKSIDQKGTCKWLITSAYIKEVNLIIDMNPWLIELHHKETGEVYFISFTKKSSCFFGLPSSFCFQGDTHSRTISCLQAIQSNVA